MLHVESIEFYASRLSAVVTPVSCVPTYNTFTTSPRGTKRPYLLTLLLKERLRLKVPSILRPASISPLMASASTA